MGHAHSQTRVLAATGANDAVQDLTPAPHKHLSTTEQFLLFCGAILTVSLLLALIYHFYRRCLHNHRRMVLRSLRDHHQSLAQLPQA